VAEVRIRRAAVEDAGALARLHVDAWRVAYRGLVPDSRLDGMDYERRAARFREQLGGHGLETGPSKAETYVAERGGEVLGFVTLGACRDAGVDPQRVGEIWGIYLGPQHWRQGAGTRLCRFAEQLLASRGYEEVKLWVLAGNSRARRFYAAMGFVADGASKVLDLDAPLEAVRYGKGEEGRRMTSTVSDAPLTIKALTLDTWDDFEALFREHGTQNGCWCMYWRTTRAECQRGYGEGNRLALYAIVAGGKVPGILAYEGDRAIAWCSIAPREDYPTLDRSRTLKRVDDRPVWSIACFFVSKAFRRQGVTERLLLAALDYARAQGAEIVEAYPLRTEITKLLPYERYMGIQSTFERVGFEVVAQESGRRPVMRLYLRSQHLS